MLTGNGGRDHGAGRLSLLALLFDEPGAQMVADAVVDGTMVSAGNLAEVATVLLRYDRDPRAVLDRCEPRARSPTPTRSPWPRSTYRSPAKG